MKKILGYSLASLIVLSPVVLKAASDKEVAAVETSTPTEDSQKLVNKQTGDQIAAFKDALEGMRGAIAKRDAASFKLYRMQAKTALLQIEKLGGVAVGTETVTEAGAAKEGRMQPTPAPTPTPTSTPEPTPTPTPTPTP